MTIQLDLARAPFAADLARHGDRPAVLMADQVLTYRELAERVNDVAQRLGPVRRLAVLAAANDVDSLVAYLAALSGGHPLILVPADKPAALESILAGYDPDVVMRPGNGQPLLEVRREGTAHALHPELALLLSTSGSTGSPKLVRLSRENLQSNAESIAGYLDIRASDRAATTLPMSYCYGLSVINSHLLRGAGLVLTDLSVVDPCFWGLFRQQSTTTFAAVPYTFELLDRVGFSQMDLPGLRYVTQAGGRLDPATAQRYRGLGQRGGWDLFVMYGQTEATARMAYLPPQLAAENPGTIGIPVPGGAFRIDPVPGLEDGELVYTGPNVMLGYAECPGDLAAGRTIDELRTGDLARRHPSGVYEVVGRRSRFVKIVGLRIDLGQVEKILAELGVPAAGAGSDRGLVVAVEGDHDTSLLGKILAQRLGLPRGAVELHAVTGFPRLANGKVDYQGVLALARPEPAPDAEPAASQHVPAGPADVRTIFADALECDDVKDMDTFVSLGGDSLSYVAASIRLEKALGQLPPDWHLLTVGDLARRGRPARRRFFAPLETGVLLRAAGIVLIIGTHAQLLHWPGMAHVLFAVAGYNFARFQLGGDRVPRLRRQLRSLGRIIVPSVAFIAVAYLLTDRYGPENIVLLNSFVGPETWTTRWDFWFIEMLVYVLISVAGLLAIPWAARAERRFPFAFPLALAAVGLLTRFEILILPAPNPAPVLWLFALGWAVARTRTLRQRILVSAIAASTVPGFFDNPYRDATILAGILLLTWLPAVPVPNGCHRLLGVLAASSLYAYLAHWLVYPGLAPFSPALAVAASLAAGVVYWSLSMRVMGAVGRWMMKMQAGHRVSPDSAAIRTPGHR
ncbi:AMP-binding protein [Arthrobacter crystallopoietes]|uniref:Acyl-CoA synthetase (AMP-forming)/AMP-acid ligase II n=1 Tax=Crystallibacter crystallopoietes TaxID=37928 RepID=A0A1H1FTJ9_9MICC|nr:AMP-binding protein [Arthrobacter crystallopoietes]AUI52924.1 AMP-dependent synthetase [Arthrobacter crystallopoietes]SDR04211.1 Acyl-CoA synthetase (AMP-forming)/AMP-acid ligase II [Arthrobacter crystallopoietes]